MWIIVPIVGVLSLVLVLLPSPTPDEYQVDPAREQPPLGWVLAIPVAMALVVFGFALYAVSRGPAEPVRAAVPTHHAPA